jgi:hypothetical protein
MTKLKKSFHKSQLEKYFRSYDLANLSDFIFSETISIDEFNKKDKNLFVINRNNELVSYINPKVTLSDGDIVFSKTEYVKTLFKLLHKSSIKNLTLITHQSDIKINRKLYSKKPRAISRWFSVNVSIEKEDLYSIPIGFANEHYRKNLNPDIHPKNIKSINKDNRIYINFNPNTNYFERGKILKKYKNNKDFVVASKNLEMSEYRNDLEKYKYVLCPPGNGIQTHRTWEALYFGSTPIVKDSILYKSFKDLNIIYVDDFNSIKIENLSKNINNQAIQYKKLFKEYYKTIFTKENYDQVNKYNFELLLKDLNKIKRKYLLVLRFNKLYKPIRSKIYRAYYLIFYK